MVRKACHTALSLILLLVGGCDRQQERSADLPRASPPPATAAGAVGGTGVVLPRLQPSADTDLAALEGSFHVEGRCLYIVGQDETKNRTLPVFAFEGVRWDAAIGKLRVRSQAFGRASARCSAG